MLVDCAQYALLFAVGKRREIVLTPAGIEARLNCALLVPSCSNRNAETRRHPL